VKNAKQCGSCPAIVRSCEQASCTLDAPAFLVGALAKGDWVVPIGDRCTVFTYASEREAAVCRPSASKLEPVAGCAVTGGVVALSAKDELVLVSSMFRTALLLCYDRLHTTLRPIARWEREGPARSLCVLDIEVMAVADSVGNLWILRRSASAETAAAGEEEDAEAALDQLEPVAYCCVHDAISSLQQCNMSIRNSLPAHGDSIDREEIAKHRQLVATTHSGGVFLLHRVSSTHALKMLHVQSELEANLCEIGDWSHAKHWLDCDSTVARRSAGRSTQSPELSLPMIDEGYVKSFGKLPVEQQRPLCGRWDLVEIQQAFVDEHEQPT
jgi:hypothetical protein